MYMKHMCCKMLRCAQPRRSRWNLVGVLWSRVPRFFLPTDKSIDLKEICRGVFPLSFFFSFFFLFLFFFPFFFLSFFTHRVIRAAEEIIDWTPPRHRMRPGLLNYCYDDDDALSATLSQKQCKSRTCSPRRRDSKKDRQSPKDRDTTFVTKNYKSYIYV